MKHALIGTLFFAVLGTGALVIAACGGSDGGAAASPGTSTPEATPIVPAPGTPPYEEPPPAYATAGTQSVEMGIGTFCWTMLCVDKIGIVTKGSLTVKAGETVSVAIPAGTPPFRGATVGVTGGLTAQDLGNGSLVWPYGGGPEQPLTFDVGQGSLEVPIDLAPGRYVLTAFMFFQPGDVVYGLELIVE